MKTLVDDERLGRIVQLVQETNNLSGMVAEMGVYQGGSLKAIAAAAGTEVLAFDSFEGLPASEYGHKEGDFRTDFEQVKRHCQGLPILWKVGLIPETFSGLDCVTFRFAHIDLDLYQSTRDALAFVWPKLTLGGVIVIDDWQWTPCQGVTEAVRELGLPIEEHRQQCVLRK